MGYIQNVVDICVFNKLVDGVQVTLMLYVNDLLATCVDGQLHMDLVEDLKGDVKFSMDRGLSY